MNRETMEMILPVRKPLLQQILILLQINMFYKQTEGVMYSKMYVTVMSLLQNINIASDSGWRQ